MFNLLICKFMKVVVIQDTECPYWDQVSLNNIKPNQTTDDPTLDYYPHSSEGDNQNEGSSVPVVCRWVWPGNKTFLEVSSMVVTWWLFSAVIVIMWALLLLRFRCVECYFLHRLIHDVSVEYTREIATAQTSVSPPLPPPLLEYSGRRFWIGFCGCHREINTHRFYRIAWLKLKTKTDLWNL